MPLLVPLAPGSPAPPVPGLEETEGPRALFFYKVTCPVCQMAAPKVEAFERGYPGRILGIGQDPEPELTAFSGAAGMTFPSLSDLRPFPLSNAYGIRTVPTMFLVEGGLVRATVEAWDRRGLNALSREMADRTGEPFAQVSMDGDGLPPFRPG